MSEFKGFEDKIQQHFSDIIYKNWKKTTKNIIETVVDALPTTGTGFTATQAKFTTGTKTPMPLSREATKRKKEALGRRRGGGTGMTEKEKAKTRLQNQLNRVNPERFKFMLKRRDNSAGTIVLNSYYSAAIKTKSGIKLDNFIRKKLKNLSSK